MMRKVTDGANGGPVDESEVARFVERFALLMVESGIPRMPARVFGALLVASAATTTR
jgi:hypothetical protein